MINNHAFYINIRQKKIKITTTVYTKFYRSKQERTVRKWHEPKKNITLVSV